MELRIKLDEKLTDRFRAVKEHIGMKSNKSVLQFLISQAYDKIKETNCRKLFVDPETYDKAEKKAAAQGQNVDIFVQELIEDTIRKSEVRA